MLQAYLGPNTAWVRDLELQDFTLIHLLVQLPCRSEIDHGHYTHTHMVPMLPRLDLLETYH